MSLIFSNTSSITSQSEELLDLHKACRIGDMQAIKKTFEQNKQSINERDDKLGWAPIYRTVICGHVEATQFLLENGADPNIKNNLGETSLHQAADNSQYKLATLLLENGADPDAQQNDGDTPLHHAAFRSDQEMIKILLTFNANPNIQNTVFNRTPLYYAVDSNNVEAVKLMLQHGANVFLKDRQGKLAIDFAKDNQIQQLLKEAEESQEDRVVEPKFNQKSPPKVEKPRESLRQKQLQMIQDYLPQEMASQMFQSLNLSQEERDSIALQQKSQKQHSLEQKTNNSSSISLQDLSSTGQYNSSKQQETQNSEQNKGIKLRENSFKDLENDQTDLYDEQDDQEINKCEDYIQEEMTFNPRQQEQQENLQEVNMDLYKNSFQSETSQPAQSQLAESQSSIEVNNVEIKAVELKIKEITEMNSKIQEAVKASIETAKNAQFKNAQSQANNLNQNQQKTAQSEISNQNQQQKNIQQTKNFENTKEKQQNISQKSIKSTKCQLEEPEGEIISNKNASPKKSSQQSAKDQFQFATQTSSRNQEEILQFLENLKLENLLDKFIEQGYDDVSQLVEMARKGLITEENLNQLGIEIPGHRYRIIACLEQKAGIQPLSSCRSTRRSMVKESVESSGMFKCCTGDKTVLKQTCKNQCRILKRTLKSRSMAQIIRLRRLLKKFLRYRI